MFTHMDTQFPPSTTTICCSPALVNQFLASTCAELKTWSIGRTAALVGEPEQICEELQGSWSVLKGFPFGQISQGAWELGGGGPASLLASTEAKQENYGAEVSSADCFSFRLCSHLLCDFGQVT